MNSDRRHTDPTPAVDRRRFLGSVMGTAGAAASFTVLAPGLVRGAKANEKVRLGLIGCGNRGNWIADLFNQHGGYEIAACADYFQDRVDSFGKKHGIPAKHRYTTLSCHEKLLADAPVDAVAIMSPPYFHPRQADAAVEAGKHVYLAKPVAVDAPGCRTIEQAGKKATDAERVFLVDFQTRADEAYIEALKRVHRGDLGTLAFGEASYHAGRLSPRAKPDGSPEHRLLNWVFYQDFSGDIITEQNVHALDVMSWIMRDKPPVRVSGTGGRKVRTDVGNCYDHFVLTYEYPDDVGISFSSRQFKAFGSKPAGIRNRMFGTDGTLETKYGGQVLIRGEKFFRGQTTGIFKNGAVTNIATFHENVTRGRHDNPTVAPSARSTLVTVAGRTAAYEGRTVTWDEIAGSSQRMSPDLSGLKTG